MKNLYFTLSLLIVVASPTLAQNPTYQLQNQQQINIILKQGKLFNKPFNKPPQDSRGGTRR
jgi:hypothetical protein